MTSLTGTSLRRWRLRMALLPPLTGLLGLSFPNARAANCPPLTFGPVPFPTRSVAAGLRSLNYAFAQTATVDVDKDRRWDLLLGSNAGVYLLRGSGTGSFSNAVNVVPGTSSALVTGDLNRDGAVDLVIASQTGTIRTALGNGDGTFKAPANVVVAPGVPGVAAYLCVIADFNGDTQPDIATANTAGNSISVLPGRGDGTFGTPVATPVPQPTAGLAVGDLNNDGFPDLACVSLSGTVQRIAVLINRSNGSFESPVTTTFAGFNLWSLRMGDLDGDPHPDLIAVSVTGSVKPSFASFRGNADLTFTLVDQKSLTLPVYGVVLHDVNGDGVADAAIANHTTVTILEGLGSGSFADPVSFPVVSSGALAAADFNGDGRSDLASFGGGASSTLTSLLNETITVPASPSLRWRQAGGRVRIVWYHAYPGYQLEKLDALDPAHTWIPIATGITELDCELQYPVPAETATAFFRLKHP